MDSNYLDEVAKRAPHTQGVMIDATLYCWTVFARHIRGPRVLELGPAEGVMTQCLVDEGLLVTSVEGAPTLERALRARFPSIEVFGGRFEEFSPQETYDSIVMGHVLEHVDDPHHLLVRAREWLAPGGVILASVPNAKSLHRQAAVLMGLLPTVYSLNESDIAHGHQRVFTLSALQSLFISSGFDIRAAGGYWLKTLSNRQIEESYSPDMVSAFMQLGEQFPEIAAECYVVAVLA